MESNVCPKENTTSRSTAVVMLIVMLHSLVMIVLGLPIADKTIYAVDSYYKQLPCIGAILSFGYFVGGVIWILIRTDKEERKSLVGSWKSWCTIVLIAAVCALPGAMIGNLIVMTVGVLNYYIPTDEPCYDAYAKVDRGGPTLSAQCYLIKFRPDNKGIKEVPYELRTRGSLEVGGEYVFTLRNGFFNIPIVIGCKHVDANDIQTERDWPSALTYLL